MSEESQVEQEDNQKQEEDTSSDSEQEQDRNYNRTYYHTPSTTLRYELAQYMNKLKSAMQELERRYEMQTKL